MYILGPGGAERGVPAEHVRDEDDLEDSFID
jgi:hypothetical protein